MLINIIINIDINTFPTFDLHPDDDGCDDQKRGKELQIWFDIRINSCRFDFCAIGDSTNGSAKYVHERRRDVYHRFVQSQIWNEKVAEFFAPRGRNYLFRRQRNVIF